jgi:hypothetical protein
MLEVDGEVGFGDLLDGFLSRDEVDQGLPNFMKPSASRQE